MTQAQTQMPDTLAQLWGTVTAVHPGMIDIAGISQLVGVGNEIMIDKPDGRLFGEILSVGMQTVTALLYADSSAVRLGDTVWIAQEAQVEIGDHWLGQVINYRGEPMQTTASAGLGLTATRPLRAKPPEANARRRLGERLSTSFMATDTLLPICMGQRVGLFAGSGIGKSTLLGGLAGGITADRVVIALIGERSREVNEFVTRKLAPDVMDKTVVVAATSSESPGAKKRAAYCAIAAAEHFRDQGHNVLFLFDSLTRFAEAHREVALHSGETPALNAYPPSTPRIVAELAERSGPGAEGMGDITAIYSVLVAGSDMEEPVADMVRGILDGHIILSRNIAERDRFPAIDILRSVSRSLPMAASGPENELLSQYRQRIALYEDVMPMLRANLYEFGRDPQADRAIRQFPQLDQFISERNTRGTADAFERLQALLDRDEEKQAVSSAEAGEE
ncbi:MAG: FliI/YscN family ATPase [Pseudomonadota bacterium]